MAESDITCLPNQGGLRQKLFSRDFLATPSKSYNEQEELGLSVEMAQQPSGNYYCDMISFSTLIPSRKPFTQTLIFFV
jgi:hypothetical protein